MAFTLTSSAFAPGGKIPQQYTGDGDNLSPPLAWSGAPLETKSFLLILQDPDAPSGVFGHWGIYNLETTALEEGIGHGDTPDQARNGFGNLHYDGPLPPKQHGVHHYHFHLAALSIEQMDVQTVDVAELWQLAQDYKIAEAELIGTYERF